jgi:diguanylate cyclase (GGDEF)-like protein
MRLTRPTLTRRIVFGYLVLALFSLSAVGYALYSLRAQVERSDRLVQVDIRTQNLLGQLRSGLLGEERLTRQYLILQQPDLLLPLEERLAEFQTTCHTLASLNPPQNPDPFLTATKSYVAAIENFLVLNHGEPNTTGIKEAAENLAAYRTNLLDHIDRALAITARQVDRTLQSLGTESLHAYQITLILVVCGLLLATAVGVSLLLHIQRSLQKFAHHIRDIGAGSFDIEIDPQGGDEFSLLAEEFQAMGLKLRELGVYQLDANPLTRLPGNLAINREIELRISQGEVFAHGFADLDHFKAYNDRYGYQRGSDVISLTGNIIRNVVTEFGDETDVVGHIGGDDYIYLTHPDKAEALAQEIISRFDQAIPDCYSEADRIAGSFLAHDRFGVERSFPLLSLSIAIVCSDNFARPTGALIGKECARMKDHLKNKPGSNHLMDRRKGQ